MGKGEYNRTRRNHTSRRDRKLRISGNTRSVCKRVFPRPSNAAFRRCLNKIIKYYGLGRNFRVGAGQDFTNGEVRMRVYDGSNKGSIKWTFAGNSHENFNAGMLRDMASMRLGNFDSYIQGTRGRKYERFRRVRNSLKDLGVKEDGEN